MLNLVWNGFIPIAVVLDQVAIIALALILVVAAMMIIVLVKAPAGAGVDQALKIWGGVGTIVTAIVTFYFTNNANQKQIQQVTDDKKEAVAKVDQLTGDLKSVAFGVSPQDTNFMNVKGVLPKSPLFPTGTPTAIIPPHVDPLKPKEG